jgi:hypothetical protein
MVENTGQPSLIRIIDRVSLNIPPGADPVALQQKQPLQITLVIILKSGFFRGKATITIRPTTPSGTEMPPAQFPILLEGDDRGNQIIMPMSLALPEEGLYWFEILVDQTTATKVPLRLIHRPAMLMQTAPPSGQ